MVQRVSRHACVQTTNTQTDAVPHAPTYTPAHHQSHTANDSTADAQANATTDAGAVVCDQQLVRVGTVQQLVQRRHARTSTHHW